MAVVQQTLWEGFFKEAGIPSKESTLYAYSFCENAMQFDMLGDMDKEILGDLGVKIVGHRFTILRHAKKKYPDLFEENEICLSLIKIIKEYLSSGEINKQISRLAGFRKKTSSSTEAVLKEKGGSDNKQLVESQDVVDKPQDESSNERLVESQCTCQSQEENRSNESMLNNREVFTKSVHCNTEEKVGNMVNNENPPIKVEVDEHSFNSQSLNSTNEDNMTLLLCFENDESGEEPPIKKKKSTESFKNEIDSKKRIKMRRSAWSKEVMEQAISAVIEGGMSMRASARKFNVPRSTLCDRLHSNNVNNKLCLNEAEESVIVEYIKYKYQQKEMLNVSEIRELAGLVANSNNDNPKQLNGRAGNEWWSYFRQRHGDKIHVNNERMFIVGKPLKCSLEDLQTDFLDFFKNIYSLNVNEMNEDYESEESLEEQSGRENTISNNTVSNENHFQVVENVNTGVNIAMTELNAETCGSSHEANEYCESDENVIEHDNEVNSETCASSHEANKYCESDENVMEHNNKVNSETCASSHEANKYAESDENMFEHDHSNNIIKDELNSERFEHNNEIKSANKIIENSLKIDTTHENIEEEVNESVQENTEDVNVKMECINAIEETFEHGS